MKSEIVEDGPVFRVERIVLTPEERESLTAGDVYILGPDEPADSPNLHPSPDVRMPEEYRED